ncbi:MAG: hypothetical protein RLZZ217_2122 [Planctomycetota bacterium]
MSRSIALLICLLGGLTMLVSPFLPMATGWANEVTDWFNILAAMAFVLGGGSLLKVQLMRLSARGPGWGYSAVTLLAFIVTLWVGLGKVGVVADASAPAEGSAFWWIYLYVMTPITSTLFAVLAFYVASAAFRAFRAKNLEATLLLVTAFIILLGRTFAGVVLTGWLPDWASGLRLENLAVTIMDVFNTAGNRAIIIGIALGVASTGIRLMLGLDRSYLGGDA